MFRPFVEIFREDYNQLMIVIVFAFETENDCRLVTDGKTCRIFIATVTSSCANPVVRFLFAKSHGRFFRQIIAERLALNCRFPMHALLAPGFFHYRRPVDV